MPRKLYTLSPSEIFLSGWSGLTDAQICTNDLEKLVKNETSRKVHSFSPQNENLVDAWSEKCNEPIKCRCADDAYDLI